MNVMISGLVTSMVAKKQKVLINLFLYQPICGLDWTVCKPAINIPDIPSTGIINHFFTFFLTCRSSLVTRLSLSITRMSLEVSIDLARLSPLQHPSLFITSVDLSSSQNITMGC